MLVCCNLSLPPRCRLGLRSVLILLGLGSHGGRRTADCGLALQHLALVHVFEVAYKVLRGRALFKVRPQHEVRPPV